MKKSKLLVLGLIALMLAGGLALASCGANCPGDGTSTGKGKCEFGLGSIFSSVAGECSNNCISDQMEKTTSINYKCNC